MIYSGSENLSNLAYRLESLSDNQLINQSTLLGRQLPVITGAVQVA